MLISKPVSCINSSIYSTRRANIFGLSRWIVAEYSRRGKYQRSFEFTDSQDLLSFFNMHVRPSEPERSGRGGAGGAASRQSLQGSYSQGSNPFGPFLYHFWQKRDPFRIPFIDKYGTPVTYTRFNSRGSWLINTVYNRLLLSFISEE